MSGSGAVGLASNLTSLASAQVVLNAQAGLQRGVLDLQQDIMAQLFAQMLAQLGQGIHLNIQA